MKYIVVLTIVVFLVRIDFFLGLIEKTAKRFTPAPPEVESSVLRPGQTLIPVSQDQNLKQTPREIFLSLLGSFRISPDKSVREMALEVFKNHPTMFSQKLDPELEAQVFRWRDLLHSNEPEVVQFLIDLMNILQGENQAMVKRFFALWMEIDMEKFLAAYSRTKDTNCMIITTFGDSIPEEEKLNEYYGREDALKAFLAKTGIDAVQKNLATNCLLVLSLEISKIAPPLSPQVEESGNEDEEASP